MNYPSLRDEMISGGRKRVPAPLTLRLGERNDRCCADRLQPRNSTSVAELANRWLDRGSECPRGCMEISFSFVQQTETVIRNQLFDFPREFVTSCPTEGCVR
ncbi:hypothetical protein TNCV_701991 [Trichonephila clavipes]|nr:hypothetical protein TNCV_701991 [Trichonephila clavipes]